MRSDWKKTTIEEACARVYSGGTPSTKETAYWNGDINWLSSGETRSKFIYETERKITKLGVAQSSTQLAFRDSIVIATAGQGYTRGQASFLKIDTYVNQSVLVLEADRTMVEPLFLYYNLSNRYEELRQLSDGTSTRGGLSGWIVRRMTIKLPPIDIQKKIIDVLYAIDQKIECNIAINKNLEEQARAIFNAWFIDFEPFGRVMPKSFTLTKLEKIAIIQTSNMSPSKNKNVIVEHYSIPAYDESRFPVFEASSNIKSNKYVLSNKSVMISKLNPETKRIWRPMCLSEHPICSTEFIVYEAIHGGDRDFLYSLIDSEPFFNYLCSHTTGSTNSRQRTSPRITLDFEFYLPPNDWIQKFCSMTTPLYDTISSNLIEIQALTSLRDTLLPRLISGELDVSNIEL